MLMGTDDGAVNETDFPIDDAGGIGVRVEVRQDALPDTGLLPAPETLVDGGPPPIPLGHIAPRRSRSQDPEDPMNDRPMVMGWSSGDRMLGLQQGFQARPLFSG
jgi:hypothetical protein